MEEQKLFTREEIQQLIDNMDSTNYEGMKQHLMSMNSDEEREKYLQDFAADQSGAVTDAQGAMTRADALRVDQPGMGGDPSGYRVAASPLAHIGAGMQNYQANKQYKQGQEDLGTARQSSNDQRIAALMAAMGGMPGKQAGPSPSGGPITAPSMGGPGRGAAPGGMPMSPGGMGPGGMDPMQMAMALRSR